MAYCYILRCSDGSYYVGSTTDLARRLSQHQEGLGAEYTRRRLPVELAWFDSIIWPRIWQCRTHRPRLPNPR